MHLFVGNISKNVKRSDLETEFEKFGPCKINIPKVPRHFLIRPLHFHSNCVHVPQSWETAIFPINLWAASKSRVPLLGPQLICLHTASAWPFSPLFSPISAILLVFGHPVLIRLPSCFPYPLGILCFRRLRKRQRRRRRHGSPLGEKHGRQSS